MPTSRSPVRVTGPGTFIRVAIGVCIVVVMASVTVIALKIGAREQAGTSRAHAERTDAAGSAVAPTTSPTATSGTKPGGDATRQGSIAAPKTTRPPAHKKAPTDPADLGVLVNKQHPLKPTTYAPENLASIGDEKLRTEAAGQLRKMIRAGRRSGYHLSLISGYRSADRQEALHESYVRSQGAKTADRLSARAGVSEHQTGLAADVGSGRCDLKTCFASTAAGKWVAEHAHEYGFIIRYPEGQEEVTGYSYEPWHLRFLGPELTEDYVASGARTLEAYYGQE